MVLAGFIAFPPELLLGQRNLYSWIFAMALKKLKPTKEQKKRRKAKSKVKRTKSVAHPRSMRRFGMVPESLRPGLAMLFPSCIRTGVKGSTRI